MGLENLEYEKGWLETPLGRTVLVASAVGALVVRFAGLWVEFGRCTEVIPDRAIDVCWTLVELEITDSA
jgi:hypothetical protein